MRYTLPMRFEEAQRKFGEDIVEDLHHQLGDIVQAHQDYKAGGDGSVVAHIILFRGEKPSRVGTLTITVNTSSVHWTLERSDGNHIHGSMVAVVVDNAEIATRIRGDIGTFLALPRDLAERLSA